MDASSARVPGYSDMPAEEIRARWAWVEPSVWSERMLAALYFTDRGLFSLVAAHRKACQSL